MLRIVNSPFGRVLQAIRENAFRAEALGYRVVLYRTAAGAVSAALATLAGVLMALSLRYTGPATTLSFSIMVDVLLMVVIGGMGTLYGPALGAAVIVLAQHYLQPAMQMLADAVAGLPLLPALVSPGSLAAVARAAVRADRLLSSRRHRRQPAGAATADVIAIT